MTDWEQEELTKGNQRKQRERGRVKGREPQTLTPFRSCGVVDVGSGVAGPPLPLTLLIVSERFVVCHHAEAD